MHILRTVLHTFLRKLARRIFIPNRTFLVCFGGISGEFGGAVVRKYPWWDQTSLRCCWSVLKKMRLGIYRTQIRPKTRPFFFSYRDQSGVVEWHIFTLFWSSILFSNSSSAILFNSFVWSFIFWILEVQVKKEIWKIRLHFETKKVSALSVKFTRAPASVAASNFGAKF